MSVKVDDRRLDATCRLGQGNACCRYLVVGDGFECAKHTTLRTLIDAKVEAGLFAAISDNCDGLEP